MLGFSIGHLFEALSCIPSLIILFPKLRDFRRRNREALMIEADYLRRNLPVDKASKQYVDSMERIDIIDTYIRYGVWVDDKTYRDIFNDQCHGFSKNDFTAFKNWTKFKNGKYVGIDKRTVFGLAVTFVFPVFMLLSEKHVNVWDVFVSMVILVGYGVVMFFKIKSVFRKNRIVLNALT